MDKPMVTMSPGNNRSLKEPITDMILWSTFHLQWEKNSSYQLNFTAHDNSSAVYSQLDVESSIYYASQEYIVKECIESFDTGVSTKEITALHVYMDIDRIYQHDTQEGKKTYSIDDVVKYWLDGNSLGFTYEVHGSFDHQEIENLGNGSGKDMLSKVLDTWKTAVIFPDNRKIRIYTPDEFFKSQQRRVDYLHNSKSVKFDYNTLNIVNQVKCIGAKHTVELSNVTGSGNGTTTAVNGNWTEAIKNAANMMGVNLDDTGLSAILRRINQESGGSETVTNNWDSNAAAGHPSTGLLQYIQSTFEKWCVDGHTDIHKGFDQLLAMFNDSNWLADISVSGGWGPTGHKRMSKAKNDGTAKTTNGWGWPFPSVGEGTFMQSQKFGYDGGYRQNSFHDGLDFGSIDHPGSEVHAVHGGKVTAKAWGSGGINWYVVITDDGGLNVEYQEAFGSESNITVNVGDTVKTGQVIGYRTTDHLHIGITKMSIPAAFSHAFSNDGTWLDPQEIIKNGISSGDNSETVSVEVYYFEPFIVTDEESVKKWGVHPGQDIEDERFTDAESMRKYVLANKLHPEPDLSIEASFMGQDAYQPDAGEILRVQIPGKGYSESVQTVGFDRYPMANNSSVTLNATPTTILDYQRDRKRQIDSVLTSQKNLLSSVSTKVSNQEAQITQLLKSNGNDVSFNEETMERIKKFTEGGT
ncbi:MAG: phage tail protein [Limosilactobacillus fermentum]